MGYKESIHILKGIRKDNYFNIHRRDDDGGLP